MAGMVENSAVVALEGLYATPMKDRELAQVREIFTFLRANGQGKVLEKVPSVDSGASVLDIVALLDAITKRGGVRRVQEQSLWKDVMTDLGYPFDRQTLFALSMHYKNFLYGYEQATFGARPDVGAQQHPLPQQQQQQQARVGQVTGRAQQLEYQRHMRQQEFDQQQQQQQQQQLRQQRQMEVQQLQRQRQEEQQRKEDEQRLRKKEEEEHDRRRKLQEQQQHLVKQQQQQLQMEQQQLFRHQQQRQQAQHHMILKQQQHQQPPQQHHRAQAPPYRHGAFLRSPADGHKAGTAFQHGNSRARSVGPGSVSASIPRRDLPRALRSTSSPSEVVAAVNTLTLETFEATEELVLEDIPGLFDAIFDLMDSLNPAVTQVITLAQTLRSQIPKGAGSTPALLDASFKWAERPGGLFGGCSAGLPPSGRGELLLLLLNALRNASFVPSNELVIGRSARAIQHFVSLCSATRPEPAVFAATLDLFGRVTKHVDIWGRRDAETDYEGCKWAEDSLSYLAPAHVRMTTRSSSAEGGGGGITSPSVLEYVSNVVLLFPTLVSMVDDEDRPRVLSALAILSKLAQVGSNKEAFNRVPGCFLGRLVELLTIPKLGCDVLATKAGVSSQEWLEYNCRVMHPVDAGTDDEVRDSALEVMSLLAGLSDSLRSRLGAVPGCARALTNVVIANTKGIRIDPQARRMAALTLTSLGAAESNHPRMRSLYSDLLVAAARDPQVAELLFHGLKAVFPTLSA